MDSGMSKSTFVVAVAGATGAVGREMLRTLEQRSFPVSKLVALASKRSAGQKLPYRGSEVVIEELGPKSFEGVDIALFSAGASVSREYAPIAARAGAVVIDNSSAWRMDPEVPLVVPEVNIDAAKHRPKGIIANPNCSTIQMVVALKPLHDAARIKTIIVSTYQATSGKGQAAVEDLLQQTRAALAGETVTPTVFPGRMAFNVLCDWKAGENDYSEEELKMVNETRKIMGDDSIGVSPTTQSVTSSGRVPQSTNRVNRSMSSALRLGTDSAVVVGAACERCESASAASTTAQHVPRNPISVRYHHSRAG